MELSTNDGNGKKNSLTWKSHCCEVCLSSSGRKKFFSLIFTFYKIRIRTQKIDYSQVQYITSNYTVCSMYTVWNLEFFYVVCAAYTTFICTVLYLCLKYIKLINIKIYQLVILLYCFYILSNILYIRYIFQYNTCIPCIGVIDVGISHFISFPYMTPSFTLILSFFVLIFFYSFLFSSFLSSL